MSHYIKLAVAIPIIVSATIQISHADPTIVEYIGFEKRARAEEKAIGELGNTIAGKLARFFIA